MRTLIPLLTLAALILEAAPAHAGACAPRVPLAAPIVSTLAPDGAVIAGWSPSGRGLHELATWRLRMRGKRVKTTSVTLAPGLLALTPSRRGRGLAMVDDRGHAVAPITIAATTAPALAAPTIKTLFLRIYQTRDGARGELLADLDVPDDAIIALLYDASEPATAPAVSWTRVAPGVQATLYADPHRCEIKPAGMRSVAVGGKVTVAWLDRFGRVSPRSAPFTVGADPDPALDPDASPRSR